MKRSHLAAITFSMVLALLVSFSVANAQPWYDAEWQYRKAITITASPVPENFPMLVDIIDNDLQLDALSNGDDILFTEGDGTTKLPHEIESYDGTTGHLIAWVKISTSDTLIYMYYGNCVASPQENPEGVWDVNYMGVWHLDDASNLIDSTGNGNDGTSYGTSDTSDVDPGKVDGAQSFNGTAYIDCGDIDITGSMTVEAWVFSNSVTGDDRVLAKDKLGEIGQFVLWIKPTGEIAFRVASSLTSDPPTYWYTAVGPSIITGEWTHVVGVYDDIEGDPRVKLYIDGNLKDDVTGPSVINSNDRSFTIGAADLNGQNWDGKIDEVRISAVARSADWISASYNNVQNALSFYNTEIEEGVLNTPPAAVDPAPADGITNVAFSLADVSFTLIDCQDDSIDYTVTMTSTPDVIGGAQSGTTTSGETITITIVGGPLDYETEYTWIVVASNPSDPANSTERTYTFTTEKEPEPWWDCAWDYRKKIVIDNAQGTEDLTDFPVLIEFTDDLDVAMNAETDGADIVFTGYDGTVLLDHEIEYYDHGSGSLVAWVRIPTLSSTTNTVIYMYYGNPNPSAGDPTLVWINNINNYSGVWHLHDDFLDSTSNYNDGTSMNPPVPMEGKVAGAQLFDGANNYIDCGNDSTLAITGSMTVEAWAYSDNGSDNAKRIVAKDNVGVPGKFILWKNSSGDLAFIVRGFNENNVELWYRAQGNQVTDGAWFHVVGVFDADNEKVRLYKNGVEVVVPPVGGPVELEENIENVTIGASYKITLPQKWDHIWKGMIDEVRIANTVRSAGWILTSYTNQDDPGSFLVKGDEETPESTGYTNTEDLCDGIDNNCDGWVDENYNVGAPCSVGNGVCNADGEFECIQDNTDTDCSAVKGLPTGDDENCNSVDENCDGTPDDGYVATPTSCGQGVCVSTGQLECQNGTEVDTCTAGDPTGADTDCNGADENCEGTPDDGYVATPTSCGQGVCVSTGQLECQNGTEVDTCTAGDPTGADTDCNGADENCDGTPDDGYVATPTSCGQGVCASTGQLECQNGTEVDNCTPGTPSDEICDDEIDNDCDGEEDFSPVIVAITGTIEPTPLGESASVSVDFTDLNEDDTHTATIDWGDDIGHIMVDVDTESGVEETYTYTQAGVYAVTVTVSDGYCEDSSATYQYIVVYDPNGGFVTGGGWINSPAGAYTPDPELTGKANFGFVSKYKKGATVPTGQTQFQFKVADLNFHSDTYDWLVIAGPKAQYKGTGTINGDGNYGFMLTAIDEKLTPSTDIDMFRIKIWDKDDGDAIVYDNKMYAEDDADPTTEIGGGSIVIHKGKK